MNEVLVHPTGFTDEEGRQISVLEVPSFERVPPELCLPSGALLLIAADARDAPESAVLEFARRLVRAGGVSAACWGPGCERVERAFDTADQELNPDEGDDRVVLTTCHPDATLDEMAWFLRSVACPSEGYRESCRASTVVVVKRHVELSDVLGSLARGSNHAV